MKHCRGICTMQSPRARASCLRCSIFCHKAHFEGVRSGFISSSFCLTAIVIATIKNIDNGKVIYAQVARGSSRGCWRILSERMSMKQVFRATIQSLVIDKPANPLGRSSLDPCELLIFLFFEMMFYSNHLLLGDRSKETPWQNGPNDEVILSESILT